MPLTRLSLRIVPLLLAMASALAYGSGTGIARGSLAWKSALVRAVSSPVDRCLVGRWVSTKVTGLAGTGSGLAKMRLTILANGYSTLNLADSTPYVTPSIDATDIFVGTEVFRIASSHAAAGDGFSIFPSNKHYGNNSVCWTETHESIVGGGFRRSRLEVLVHQAQHQLRSQRGRPLRA